jgi:hypothetical protein
MQRSATLLLLAFAACAGTGSKGDAAYLFVQNAREAHLKDGRLTMKGVGTNAIYFTDRPYRKAGHIQTSRLMFAWNDGEGSFAEVPPNAVLSVFHHEGIHDVVVVLRNAKLEGDTVTYDVDIVDGKPSAAGGPAALFIDDLAPWPAVRHGMHDQPGAKSREGMHSAR